MNDVIDNAPRQIVELRLRCQAHVKNRIGIDLDGKSETLSVVDFFVRDLLTEEGGGAMPPVGDHRRANAMHLMASTIGAYFGEVVRSIFPCRWRLDSNDPKLWTIEFDIVPLRFNPVGAAAEAFLDQHADEWGGSLITTRDQADSLEERLNAAPPVPEDEFFALTTRLEVLQIAVEWLRVRLSLGSLPAPDYYSASDYDEMFNA